MNSLHYLELSRNKIEELIASKRFNKLKHFWIYHIMKLKDVNPLKRLTNLRKLDLRYNRIADDSPLNFLSQTEIIR